MARAAHPVRQVGGGGAYQTPNGSGRRGFFQTAFRGVRAAPLRFSADAEAHRARPLGALAAWLEPLPESRFTLGAFLAGDLVGAELIGTAGFVRGGSPKIAHTGSTWGVYVTERARGSGVGRELLEALIARVRSFRGVEQTTLSVSTRQTAARALYLSLGFEVYGFEVYGLERRALKIAGEYADEEHLILYFLVLPLTKKTRRTPYGIITYAKEGKSDI